MLSFSKGPDLKRWPGTLCLIAMLHLAVLSTGCGNSCYSLQSNPGGGGVNVSSPCLLPVTPVFAGAQLAPQCQSCSPSNQVQHLFLTLRGIELHPRTNAGQAPSDWQVLAPLLEIQPQQFEFNSAGATPLVPNSLGDGSAVPAGDYDLVRLIFAASPGSAADRASAENQCGSAGLNCAVMGDGRVLPLALPRDALELPGFRGGSLDGVFSALPATEIHLLIEFTATWSLDARASDGARLVLVLQGTARTNDKRPPAIRDVCVPSLPAAAGAVGGPALQIAPELDHLATLSEGSAPSLPSSSQIPGQVSNLHALWYRGAVQEVRVWKVKLWR